LADINRDTIFETTISHKGAKAVVKFIGSA